MTELGNTTESAEASSEPAVEKEPKRYPVLVRPANWRSSDWPVLAGFKTLDEFALEAEFYNAEHGDTQQPTEKRIIQMQLTAPETLGVLSAIRKLSRDDPENWGNAPDRRSAAIVEICMRYSLMIDAAERRLAKAQEQGTADMQARSAVSELNSEAIHDAT